MDHNCDSFYNSQQRISRFPGLVYAGTKDLPEGETIRKYDVFMTGTPPKKMRWRLDVKNKDAGFMVQLSFPDSLARAVLVNGEEVPYTDYEKATETKEAGYAEITGEFCG